MFFVVSFLNDVSKDCFASDGTLLPGFTHFASPKHFNHIFHFFDNSGFGGIICQIRHILNLAIIVLGSNGLISTYTVVHTAQFYFHDIQIHTESHWIVDFLKIKVMLTLWKVKKNTECCSGFTCLISFAPEFSFIYCWVLIFALSPFLYLDLYVLRDDALIS